MLYSLWHRKRLKIYIFCSIFTVIISLRTSNLAMKEYMNLAIYYEGAKGLVLLIHHELVVMMNESRDIERVYSCNDVWNGEFNWNYQTRVTPKVEKILQTVLGRILNRNWPKVDLNILCQPLYIYRVSIKLIIITGKYYFGTFNNMISKLFNIY